MPGKLVTRNFFYCSRNELLYLYAVLIVVQDIIVIWYLGKEQLKTESYSVPNRPQLLSYFNNMYVLFLYDCAIGQYCACFFQTITFQYLFVLFHTCLIIE